MGIHYGIIIVIYDMKFSKFLVLAYSVAFEFPSCQQHFSSLKVVVFYVVITCYTHMILQKLPKRQLENYL